MVKSVLTNEKYIGLLVYNRQSGKLSKQREHNNSGEWVINAAAIPQRLSRPLFNRAQVERARRTKQYKPAKLLDLLRGCHERNGKVTASLIAGDSLLPNPQLFVRTFGSLMSAYDATGLPRSRLNNFVDAKRIIRNLRQALFMEIQGLAEETGASVEALGSTYTFLMNKKNTVRVDVLPFCQPARGRTRWKVRHTPQVDFVIAARHDPFGIGLLDFYLLPNSKFQGQPIYLKGTNPAHIEEMRYATVRNLFFADPS